jgi:hypothetical protein
MWFTVVPLHGLNLPCGTRIPFGSQFVLQDIPEWLRQDRQILTPNGKGFDAGGEAFPNR